MSIEIRSRWDDDKILYTAKDAKDVREALEEAVEAGANLRSADLRSADLYSADLYSANLPSLA